jgi:hypothetical protein
MDTGAEGDGKAGRGGLLAQRCSKILHQQQQLKLVRGGRLEAEVLVERPGIPIEGVDENGPGACDVSRTLDADQGVLEQSRT